MSEHLLTNVLEAILLAAGRPLSIAQITELFAESERPTDADVREAFERPGPSLRRTRHRAGRSRERLAHPGATGACRRRLAPLAGASSALFACLARDARARRLPAADHARRDRVDPRRDRRLDHHADAVRAQLDPRGRAPRGSGRPELLGTTREFLDYFGLRALDELPTLAELRDLDEISVQLELARDGMEARASLPAASIGELPSYSEEAGDDQGALDDEESEQTSDADTPTLVAGPAASDDR